MDKLCNIYLPDRAKVFTGYLARDHQAENIIYRPKFDTMVKHKRVTYLPFVFDDHPIIIQTTSIFGSRWV